MKTTPQSSDGDKQADHTRLRWAFSKPAHASFYLGGRRFLHTYLHPERGDRKSVV